MTQLIATNRNEIADNAKKTLQDLALVFFGYGGLIFSFGLCVFMWQAIAFEKPELRGTFQVLGTFTHEAQIVMGGILYLVFFHCMRYYAAFKMADERFLLTEQPKVNSEILRLFSKAVLWMFGPSYFVWLIASRGEGSNLFLLPTFVVLAAVTLYVVKRGFIYPFGLDAAALEALKPVVLEPVPERAYRKVNGAWTDSNQPAAQTVDPVARERKARFNFGNIYGNTELKQRLLEAGKSVIRPRKQGEEPRNGILLDGKPGNGKTAMAEALAGELDLPLFTLTHSDVASQWVGERTVSVRNAFNQAIQNQPCVFFIDEIDSFLSSRGSEAHDQKEDRDVVNSLLTLLVDIREHKVVVMAATNYADKLDAAAVREGRFDFKVEVTPPDEEARIGLLTHGLNKRIPKIRTTADTIKSVAQRWNGYSVKRILAVTEELPSYIAEQEKNGRVVEELVFEDFMAALRRIQGHKGARPENVKPMSELVLPEVTREAMTMLAGRLRDPQRVERLGGTLPSGVLFYGPPGTGKTVACKALAKEVGWAFLIATGPDLARDPKALEKLYNKAADLRPAIIFIDEADDLVRSREYSNYTEATNKLLTLMDGVDDRIKDVVWVAATNHYDQIDPALLRGGRFTEKVQFVRPDADQLEVHIQKWVEARKVKLEGDVTPLVITQMLGDQSIANAEAVMQSALNRAISMSASDEVCISAVDVERAVTTVLG
jgi:transitional endoplasmic reticulum ATPase